MESLIPYKIIMSLYTLKAIWKCGKQIIFQFECNIWGYMKMSVLIGA